MNKLKQHATQRYTVLSALAAIATTFYLFYLYYLSSQSNIKNPENSAGSIDIFLNHAKEILSLTTSLASITGWMISEFTRFGTLPGAMAQTTTPAYPQLELTQLNLTSVTDKPVSVVFDQRAALAFLIGGDFCVRSVDLSTMNPFVTGAFGVRTPLAFDCQYAALDKTKGLLHVAQMDGLGVYNVSIPRMITRAGGLTGFTAENPIILDKTGQFAMTPIKDPQTPALFSFDVANPSAIKLAVTPIPWQPGWTPSSLPSDRIRFALANAALGISAWDGANYRYQTTIFPLDTAVFFAPRLGVPLTWGKPLTSLGNSIGVIKSFSISDDGSYLFAAVVPQFVTSALSKGPIEPSPGVLKIDIRNSSSWQIARTQTIAQGSNALISLGGENDITLVATDVGVGVYNNNQLIPTKQPLLISQWLIPSGVLAIKLSADGRFVHTFSKSFVYQLFLLQDFLAISSTKTTIIPLFYDHPDATLDTEETNDGKLLCITPEGAMPHQIPCHIENSNVTWFLVNPDGAFHATPPKNESGIVIIGLNNQSLAASFLIKAGIPVITTLPATALVTIPITTQPITTDNALDTTPIPSSTTGATPPAATNVNPFQNITHAPDQTFPAQPGIEIIVNTTVRITSTASSLTLLIQLEKLGIGQFMTKVGNLGSVIVTFDESLGRLTAIGSPSNLNTLLEKLRFSLDDPAYEDGTVLIAVSQNGQTGWAYGSATLKQFGKNTAPILISPYLNQNRQLGASFTTPLDLPSHFQDADGDTLTPLITSEGGEPLPSWIVVMRNAALVGTSFVPANVSLSIITTDGYKKSPAGTFFVVYEYVPPQRLKPIADMTIYPGTGITIPIPLDTFSSGIIAFTAKQLIGNNTFALPAGIDFDAARLQFGFLVAKNGQWSIVVTGTDNLGASVSATFQVTAFEPIPQLLSNRIAITTNATKPFSVILPQCVHPYATLSYRVTMANGSPLALIPWAQFNAETREFSGTPLASTLDTQHLLSYTCKTTTEQAASNNTLFTLIVRPNDAPIIGCMLPSDLRAITSRLFTLLIGCAFSDPNNDPLTFTVTGVNWLSVDGDRLSGTPDERGKFIANLTATDPFGASLSRLLSIDVEFSSQDLFWHWFNLLWPVLLAAPTAFTVYQLWPHFYNTLFASRYRKKDPFSAEKLEYSVDKTLGEVTIACFRKVDSRELGLAERAAAPFSGCSHYLNRQLTLRKLANGDDFPKWLTYDDTRRTLTIIPTDIQEDDRTITVQITSLSGRLLQEFDIDPARYRLNALQDTHVIEVTPPRAASTSTSAFFPSPASSEESNDSLSSPLLKLPEKPVVKKDPLQIAKIPDDKNQPSDYYDASQRKPKNPLRR